MLRQARYWILANPDLSSHGQQGLTRYPRTPSNPALAQMLSVARRAPAEQDSGCFPAPEKILCARR